MDPKGQNKKCLRMYLNVISVAYSYNFCSLHADRSSRHDPKWLHLYLPYSNNRIEPFLFRLEMLPRQKPLAPLKTWIEKLKNLTVS